LPEITCGLQTPRTQACPECGRALEWVARHTEPGRWLGRGYWWAACVCELEITVSFVAPEAREAA